MNCFCGPDSDLSHIKSAMPDFVKNANAEGQK